MQTSRYFQEKQAYMIKKCRYLICEKSYHTADNYTKKEKIVINVNNMSKNSNNHWKINFFQIQ